MEVIVEFGKRTEDNEQEIKILNYRLYEDHEPRLEKLEEKVFA